MKKKLIFFLCIAFLFTGCAKNKGDSGQKSFNQSNQKAYLEAKQENEIMNTYNKLMQKNITEKEIIEFVNNNIVKVSKTNASRLVLGIEVIQKKNIDKRTDEFFKGNYQQQIAKEIDYPITSDKIEKIKDPDVKHFLKSIVDSGYGIIMKEEAYYPTIDYRFFKKYRSYVNFEVKDYIDIMAMGYKGISIADANLVSDWDEIFKRAIKCERFLENYPNSQKIKAIKEQYLLYVRSYLYGADNTPAFRYDNNGLNRGLKTSYLTLKSRDLDRKLGKIIREYLIIIRKNNYNLTDEVQKYRENIIHKLEREV